MKARPKSLEPIVSNKYNCLYWIWLLIYWIQAEVTIWVIFINPKYYYYPRVCDGRSRREGEILFYETSTFFLVVGDILCQCRRHQTHIYPPSNECFWCNATATAGVEGAVLTPPAPPHSCRNPPHHFPTASLPLSPAGAVLSVAAPWHWFVIDQMNHLGTTRDNYCT